MFLKTNDFEIYQMSYDDNQKQQVRIKFSFYLNFYDFPVTDPVFLKKYKENPKFINDVNQIDLTLSLGVEYKEWYYKLIASVMIN